jgi:hypothetical protein
MQFNSLIDLSKVVVLPLRKDGEKTTLLVRLENLENAFDDKKLITTEISMDWLVQKIYSRANPKAEAPDWSMFEVALGNNQSVEQAQSKRRAWKGEDESPAPVTRLVDHDSFIAVRPMEIRQFQVTI